MPAIPTLGKLRQGGSWVQGQLGCIMRPCLINKINKPTNCFPSLPPYMCIYRLITGIYTYIFIYLHVYIFPLWMLWWRKSYIPVATFIRGDFKMFISDTMSSPFLPKPHCSLPHCCKSFLTGILLSFFPPSPSVAFKNIHQIISLPILKALLLIASHDT
jgi:hypothetical protein